LDWIGLDWIGLDWIGLDWIGLDWIGLDWIGLDWIGLDWIGLDWSEIELLLSSIYPSTTGRPSYPLLSLFRSLLLGIWYPMSAIELAKCLYRDLLFRKFCRYELAGNVPEASTLGRFRNQLVEHDLWDRLLGEINRQLEAKNIIMR
jgi:IS5 family transposase